MVEDIDRQPLCNNCYSIKHTWASQSHLPLALDFREFSTYSAIWCILDISWPSSSWGPHLQIIFGDFQHTRLIILLARFFAYFDEFYIPQFYQGHLVEAINRALGPCYFCGEMLCHFVGNVSLWLCTKFEIYCLIRFEGIDPRWII